MSQEEIAPIHETAATVVLADARTRCEREAINRWAAEHHPGARIADVDRLTEADLSPDALLVPVRVVWMPPGSPKSRRLALDDLMVLRTPWRPPAGLQGAIHKRSPERVHVVAGEPGTVDDLRGRYDGSVAAGEPFADFVRVQAVLAAERAERQLVGDRYKVPRLVAEQISSSARFRRNASELALELGRTEASVVQEATDKLSAFVATQSRLMIDLFTSMFSVMHERAWTVSVDVDTLEGLRRSNRDTGLVFLPAHRSYMDPLVLGKVLRERDFPPNHVLGGMNMSFWPIGPIGRRAGLIFIRRSFGDDAVYKFAMRSYLAHLVEKRFNLEWYIEGGRSRTGKLRKPRLGLLSYVVDAVETLPDADLTVVPTSIVYDQTAEVGAMAAEMRGGKKKAEGLGWLFGYARAQRSDLGTARVRFGETFSLREALQEAGEGPARLEKVAFRVMDGINAATPVSATALATFALLGTQDRASTETEVEQILRPLLEDFERRGLPGPDPALCRGAGLRTTLEALRRAGVVLRYDEGSEPVWWIASENHSVAAYYRNAALHHLVNRALVELTLLAVSDGAPSEPGNRQDLLAAAGREALRVRDLLKFEFFFPTKTTHLEQLAAEMDLLTPGWRTAQMDAEWARQVLREHGDALVARRTLQPFFDAQLVVARRLVQLGDSWEGREKFLTDCLGLGGQLVLQEVVRAQDSVSKELYGAALDLADNRGLVESDHDDLPALRQHFLDEVVTMHDRLVEIAGLETNHRQEAAG